MTTSAMSTNDIKWNVKKDIIKVTYGSKYQEEYYAVHYISYLLTLDQSKNENGLQKTYIRSEYSDNKKSWNQQKFDSNV